VVAAVVEVVVFVFVVVVEVVVVLAVAVGVVEVVVELVVEWWWLPRAVGGGTALLWNIALCKCCSSGCSPLQSATDALAQQWDIRIPCSLSMFLSTEMKPTFCNELNLSP
jgi:hypothetical protein